MPRAPTFANVVSMLALVAGLGWLLFVIFQRRIEPFAAAAAAVALFVLCNKVYSPTYDVWLVVFFVMLPLSRRLWVTFCAVDLAVFATVYGYFGGIDSRSFVRVGPSRPRRGSRGRAPCPHRKRHRPRAAPHMGTTNRPRSEPENVNDLTRSRRDVQVT